MPLKGTKADQTPHNRFHRVALWSRPAIMFAVTTYLKRQRNPEKSSPKTKVLHTLCCLPSTCLASQMHSARVLVQTIQSARICATCYRYLYSVRVCVRECGGGLEVKGRKGEKNPELCKRTTLGLWLRRCFVKNWQNGGLGSASPLHFALPSPFQGKIEEADVKDPRLRQ